VLIIKPTRRTDFSNFILEMKLYISDISSVYHQELFTVHSATVYVIQVCWQRSSSRIRMELQLHPDPAARKLSTNLYDIYHRWVYSEWILMMDRGTVRNIQIFFSKIKFEKLVHLVGFIIRKFVTMHGHMSVKYVHTCIYIHIQKIYFFIFYLRSCKGRGC
jgi:hypothetical protein